MGDRGKTLIQLDPDPASWGSNCDERTAARANNALTEMLERDGFDVEMNDVSETFIAAETDDERERAQRCIERHAQSALDAALDAAQGAS